MSFKIKLKPPSIESSSTSPQPQTKPQPSQAAASSTGPVSSSKQRIKIIRPQAPSQTLPKINLKLPTKSKKASAKGKAALLNSALNSSKQPKVKKYQYVRTKPVRVPGEGYDSEDSEIEDDPLVEEGLILRLLPDAELDYVRSAVDSGDFSNFQIKWKDSKRAIIFVNETMYGAKLIHLPNIIEVQKSIDRKSIFKTIDVSQILLVVKRIEAEEEIKEIVVNDDETLESGITPPLRHVTKSRARKDLNHSRIQSLEAKVDELLRLDDEAEDSTYELVDPESLNDTAVFNNATNSFVGDSHNNSHNGISGFTESSSLDISSDLNTKVVDSKDDQVDDLEMAIEEVLGEEEGEEDLFGDAGEETAENGNGEGEEAEEEELVVAAQVEESEDDDDDDDEDENDNSENEQEGQTGVSRKIEIDEDEQHNALIRDEINELMTTIEQNKARLGKTHNPLLQNRILDSINKLEKELNNKQRQLKTGEDKARQVKDNSDDEDEENEEEENNEDEEEGNGGDDEEDEEEEDDMDDLFGG